MASELVDVGQLEGVGEDGEVVELAEVSARPLRAIRLSL